MASFCIAQIIKQFQYLFILCHDIILLIRQMRAQPESFVTVIVCRVILRFFYYSDVEGGLK